MLVSSKMPDGLMVTEEPKGAQRPDPEDDIHTRAAVEGEHEQQGKDESSSYPATNVRRSNKARLAVMAVMLAMALTAAIIVTIVVVRNNSPMAEQVEDETTGLMDPATDVVAEDVQSDVPPRGDSGALELVEVLPEGNATSSTLTARGSCNSQNYYLEDFQASATLSGGTLSQLAGRCRVGSSTVDAICVDTAEDAEEWLVDYVDASSCSASRDSFGYNPINYDDVHGSCMNGCCRLICYVTCTLRWSCRHC